MTPEPSLRPEQFPADEALLMSVFASSRGALFDMLPLPPEQKSMLIRQQFMAQRQGYLHGFSNPAPDFNIIEIAGEDAGRLYTHQRTDSVHIIDITLLPHFRGKGYGGTLLGRVLGQAQARGQAVSLSVEEHNPALQLYRRLGFAVTGQKPPYIFMSHAPVSASATSDPARHTCSLPGEISMTRFRKPKSIET